MYKHTHAHNNTPTAQTHTRRTRKHAHIRHMHTHIRHMHTPRTKKGATHAHILRIREAHITHTHTHTHTRTSHKRGAVTRPNTYPHMPIFTSERHDHVHIKRHVARPGDQRDTSRV